MIRPVDAYALIGKLTYSPDGSRYREFDCDNFPATISVKEVKDMIRQAPTVEPEQKTCEITMKKRQKYRETPMMMPYCGGCGMIVYDARASYCCWCGSKFTEREANHE